MARKTSNLKIVEQHTEAELQAKYEQEKAHKQRREEEESWRLTRPEITARARAVRVALEAARARLEGVPFDVVSADTPPSLTYTYGNTPQPFELAEAFDPTILALYQRVKNVLPEDRHAHDDLADLEWHIAETAFQIGVLAGAMFSGASDREIGRLERGLIHATVSRGWRCKDQE